jgi:division/cell wall cluster transcriptional repressor MraZ
VQDDVFVGEFGRSVDAAGRVALPPTFRDLLGERCYATRDRQGCIILRSAAQYAVEAKRLRKQEKRGSAPAGTARNLSTRTVNIAIDKQGRVTLDEQNRSHAAIDAGGQVVVIGDTETVEVWRPSRWAVVTREDAGLEPDRVWPAEVDAS